MEKLPKMVDMARSTEEQEEVAQAISSPPTYPYGLCISLCGEELDKLGFEDDDLEPGDMVHLHCMATVTSISKQANADSSNCRVELQITAIAAEDEDEENEEYDSTPSKARPYF